MSTNALGIGLVYAGDISWKGQYRAEGVQVNGTDGVDPRRQKSYLLHHLVLKPSIVAADGFTIRSRFDVFNNANYPGSQLGQFIGNGPRSGAIGTTGANATGSYNSLANHQQSDTIAVNELYLTYQHEFGALVIGRAPLDFGLGMTYNMGRDPFAHWLTNRDMVGYRVTFGNFSLMPMYGKVDEGNLDYEDDINDYMLQLEYDNPDSGLSTGVFFTQRIAMRAGNDTPTVNGVVGGDGSTNVQNASLTQKSVNVFFKREYKTFTGGLEIGFVDGRTGVQTIRNVDVTRNGFGIAAEFEYRPEESRNKYSIKTGLATGDNGNTTDRFESFAFNRNYQVGELMFNHLLGRGDFLTTQFNRSRITGRDDKQNAAAFADVESVSNVFYFSPAYDRHITDSWHMNVRGVYGVLNQAAWRDIERNTQESLSRDFGYELDLGASYRPFPNVVWQTTVALFWPGGAFRGGSAGYNYGFTEGAFTKFSIEF